MRTITITKNLYSYDELSESAKENVRSWLSQDNYIYASEIIDSVEAICKATGLKTGRTYSDIENTCDYLTGIRAYKYIYNNFIYPNRRPKLHYSQKKGRFLEYKLHDEYCCNFTGVCYDYILWDAWNDFKEYFRVNQNQSIDDFCYILSGKIKDEYENLEQWLYSDEYARETCNANEYEFDEYGNIA